MKHQVSIDIFHELCLLGEAFLLGVLLMVVYDIIRFFRHLFHHPLAVVVIEDLLFWVVASLCIFYLLYLENSGRVRMYAIGGTAAGMLLYYVLWARRWMKWYDKLLEIVKNSWIFKKKG